MPNFVFIAAGKKLAELGYRFRETLPFPASFTVVETKMEDAVDYCKHQLPDGTDAIIARGNTANMLRSARIPVPVITLPIKDSELIRSITTAAALYPGENSRIAYIGLEDVISSVSEFLKMIHQEIRFFRIDDSRDIKNCIRQAKQEHIQVVIGGEYTKELAEAQGLRCVLLESTENSLKEAYERAQEIQKGVLLQKKKFQEKLILMNAISDAIVGINEKGRISLFNQAAETLFARKEAQALGKAASILFSDEELGIINRVLLRGDEILSHPTVLSDQPYLIDFRPVLIHNQSRGIIICIHADSTHNTGFPQNTDPFPTAQLLYNYPVEPSGQSQAFLSACALSARFASSPLPVLITGESGTGKTTFAYRIHRQSSRKEGTFLVREGALLTPEDLMAANGGSLCIHDVDTLSPAMLPVLNQYLEHGIVAMPDQSFRQLDVRIFATISQPLSSMVPMNEPDMPDYLESQRTFFPDSHLASQPGSHQMPCLPPRLYYNLNALTLSLPPLRERPEDIWPLFSSILETFCQKTPDTSSALLPEDAAASLLTGYSWLGNVRQLQSVARRFTLLAPGASDNCAIPDANTPDILQRNLRCLEQCLRQEFAASQNCMSAEAMASATCNPAQMPQPAPQYTAPSSVTKNAPADFSAGALSPNKNFVIHGRLVSWEELKALDQYYQGRRSLLAKQLGVSRSTLWRYFKEMEADRP